MKLDKNKLKDNYCYVVVKDKNGNVIREYYQKSYGIESEVEKNYTNNKGEHVCGGYRTSKIIYNANNNRI